MVAELLNQIDSYLTLRSTIRDLETWLVSNLQQILDSGDDNAIEVANRVDADLVELGEGLVDEATLRERFSSYILDYNTIAISFCEAESTTSAHISAASETFSDQVEVPGLVEDHRVDLVFA